MPVKNCDSYDLIYMDDFDQIKDYKCHSQLQKSVTGDIRVFPIRLLG